MRNDCDHCDELYERDCKIEELEDTVELLTDLLKEALSNEEWMYLKCKYNL